jgi:hypothetical protein
MNTTASQVGTQTKRRQKQPFSKETARMASLVFVSVLLIAYASYYPKYVNL